MITIKGAKAEPAPIDPAEPYRLKEATRPSRAPFGVAGMFAAIALYFETALTSSAKPSMAAEDTPPPTADPLISFAAETGNASPRLPQTQTKPEQDAPQTTVVAQFPGASSPVMARNFAPKPASAEPKAPLESAAEPPASGNDQAAPVASATAHSGASGDTGGSSASAANTNATLEPHNAAPTSDRALFLQDVASGASLTLSVTELLAYISDADGDHLTVEHVRASSGSIVQTDTGYVFRANDDSLGPVQISYRVNDGSSVINVVAQLSIVPNAFLGTAADDALVGTAWRDELRGAAGNDNLRGLGGSDFLLGGAGKDTLAGDSGNDVIHGDEDDDTLEGGDGLDALWGGTGNDWIFGGYGADILFGDEGGDVIADGFGADAVFGGQGADTIIAALDFEDDHYDGGDDLDTLDYSAATVSLLINLQSGWATGNEIGDDSFVGIECFRTGAGDDHFLVGGDSVVMAGGAGDNTFEFSQAAPLLGGDQSMYQILDFDFGDVIVSPKFDIFSQNDAPEVTLSDAMSSGRDDEGGRIRYRYEGYDDDDRRTVVEWEDNDASHVTIVTMNGHQVLIWTEHGA